MGKRAVGFVAAGLVWTAGIFGCGVSQAQEGKEALGKSEGGLHFTVPPDWPVEKRGGVLAPVPVEEYVMERFKKIESQIGTMEKELKDTIGVLQAELDSLKAGAAGERKEWNRAVEALQGDLRTLNDSVSPHSESGAGETGSWEGRLDSFSRDVSRRLEDLTRRLEDFEQKKIRSFQFNLDVMDEKIKLLSESLENMRQRAP